MRLRFLLSLALCLAVASADAAVFTTQGSGNLASTTNNAPWSGGTPPAAGDQIIIANGHTVTVAADSVRLGNYLPARTMTNPTGASVAGGGSLPTASYQFTYTNVDSGGKESAAAPGSASVAITNGNTLRITMPAKPTGVATRNIYIATGSTSYKLYATGTTGTTYDATSASWNNGTQAEAAAAAVPNGFAITIQNGGALTIKQKLNLAGAVEQGNGIVTLDGTNGDLAAGIEWDASGADSPANTPYGWFQGTANTQANCKIITANTDASHRVFLQSNAGGANGYFRTGRGVGFVGDFTLTTQWNIKFFSAPTIGDTTRDAIAINSGTTVSDTFQQVFEDGVFGANSGALAWVGFGGGSADHSVQRVRFEQTAPRNIVSGVPTPYFPGYANTGTPAGAQVRLTKNCYFLKRPRVGQFTNWSENYFTDGYSSVSDTSQWLSVDSNLHRIVTATDQQTRGNITNNYIIFDPSKTQLETGTATSGSSTTLVNSGKSWTVDGFASAPGVRLTQVHITGGTGAGQRRRISSNTATALTISPNWSTNPDATSTYEIIQEGNSNYHGLNATGTGSAQAITGNVFDEDSVGSDGDLTLTFGGAIPYNVSNNLVLPNASGVDHTGTLMTQFNNTNASALITVNHNTICSGRQAGVMINEGGTVSGQTAGTFAAFKSNLVWIPRAYSEFPAGSFSGYKISDSANSSNPGNTTTTDIISPANADYNWGYNLNPNGFAGNSYNYKASGTPGTHDGSGDPQFVDSTRNLATWGAANGADGTMAGALALLAADPTLIPTMRDWVRDGFAPQNASLEDAGHDGVTIGAIEFVASGPTAGTIALDSKTTTTVNLTCTAASGGTAPYTYQWYRSTSSGFTPGAGNILAGETALTLADTGLTQGTTYYYVLRATDADLNTDDATELAVTTTAPNLAVTRSGAITDGGTDALGTVAQDSSQSLSYTITNSGDATATLGTITVGTGLTITANPSGQTIAPAGTKTFTVSVDTSAVASISAAVSIPSDDSDSPYNWTVTASVTDQTAPTVTSASFTSSAADEIRVNLSETCTGTLGFAVDDGGAAITVTPTNHGTYILLGLSRAADMQATTLDYDSGTGDVEDTADTPNALASFSGRTVNAFTRSKAPNRVGVKIGIGLGALEQKRRYDVYCVLAP